MNGVHCYFAITLGWDYSDPVEDDCSFNRINYCSGSVTIPSTDRDDDSIRFGPASFYHIMPPGTTQDLCSIHVRMHT